MLIRLTKSNHSAQLSLLILLTLAFWVRDFVVYTPIELIEPQTFLYNNLFGWTKNYIVLAKLLAFGSVVLQAFMLSQLAKQHSVSKKSIFIALIYIVLMSAQSCWQTLQPFLISNFFIIGGYWYVFKIYDRKDPYEFVFNAFMLFALATLFSASLLPFGLIMFSILWGCSINQWREWMIAILGFAFPFFIVFLWASLIENLDVFSEFFIPMMKFGGFENMAKMSLFNKIFVSTILIISLVGGVKLRSTNNEISQRKKNVAIIWGAIWVAIVALFFYTPAHLATLFIFCAFFITEWIFRSSRQWVSEVVFGVVLIVAAWVQYF
ncbi:MAG: hypothetical protein FWE63_07055 [Bacteroidales bacterium]|nr:hypothetical protein [Bacteroidales bacterium]